MKPKLLFVSLLALVLVVGLRAQTDPGTANLTHQWTFDDGTANDPIGAANGVLTGGATISDGNLVIDAAGEWVELNGLLIGISGYSELSVAIWFSTFPNATYNSGYHMIWYFGGSEIPEGGDIEYGSNGIFLSPARGDNKLRTAISCGNVANPWTTETGIDRLPEVAYGDSTWHMVTTINDTYMALYINGELIDTANLSVDNHLENLSDDFAWIGRGGYAGDPNYWSMVHEVAMYDKMLSDDEVLFLYQNPPEITIPSLNEIRNSFDLKVYSFNGNIYIQNPESANITSIQIYDILGKLTYQTEEFQDVIYANLPSSVYIVRIQSNLGDYVTKVAVQ
jgi:hypothetical protein